MPTSEALEDKEQIRPSGWRTVKEYAEVTGYHPRTIQKWCREGRLESKAGYNEAGAQMYIVWDAGVPAPARPQGAPRGNKNHQRVVLTLERCAVLEREHGSAKKAARALGITPEHYYTLRKQLRETGE